MVSPYPLPNRMAFMIAPEKMDQAAQDRTLLEKLAPTPDKIDANIVTLQKEILVGQFTIITLGLIHDVTIEAREKEPQFMPQVQANQTYGEITDSLVRQTDGLVLPERVHAYARGEVNDIVSQKSGAFVENMVRNHLGLSLSQIALPKIEDPLRDECVRDYVRAQLLPLAGKPLDGGEMRRRYEEYASVHHGTIDAARMATRELERWARDGAGMIPPAMKKAADKMCAALIITGQESLDPVMIGGIARVQPFVRDYQAALGFKNEQCLAFAAMLEPTAYFSKTALERHGMNKADTFREEATHLMQFHSPYKGSSLSEDTIKKAFYHPSLAKVIAAAGILQGYPEKSEDQKQMIRLGEAIRRISRYSHELDIRNEGEAGILEISSALKKMSKIGYKLLMQGNPALEVFETLRERIMDDMKQSANTMQQAACHPYRLDQATLYTGRHI